MEHAGDEADRFLDRPFLGDGGDELRESRRFRDDQSMQRNRLRRRRRAQDESGDPQQRFLEIGAHEQRQIGGRTQPIDDPMDDGAKKCRLVFEAMVERALRNSRLACDRLDARRAVAVRQKQVRRSVENPLAQLFRLRPRRSAAAA